MPKLIQYLIRYSSYPLIMGLSLFFLFPIATGTLSYWPYVPLIAAVAIGLVALLEQIQPYEQTWLNDHDMPA